LVSNWFLLGLRYSIKELGHVYVTVNLHHSNGEGRMLSKLFDLLCTVSHFHLQVVSYLSCFFISLSIAAFCVSTLPGIRTEETIMGSPYWLSLLELFCSSFFTLEFLMRLVFCPTKLLFFKRPMNWIDLISILPFYVSQVSDDDKVKMFLVIRVLRLFRYVDNK